MDQLTFHRLREACAAGGPSVLVSTTELAPAGGPLASVAPARFVTPGQNGHATYAYEHRFEPSWESWRLGRLVSSRRGRGL